MFLGESVPRFDLVMGLVGSTLTGPLMFIFPPLFFLKLCHKRSSMKELDFLIERRKRSLKLAETESNFTKNGGQNGNLSKFPLILPRTQTKYKTFVTQQDYIDYIAPNVDVADYTVKWYDVLLAVIVMMMGIVATFVATYISWSDAISSAEFSPPCLLNATAAARSFIEATTKQM